MSGQRKLRHVPGRSDVLPTTTIAERIPMPSVPVRLTGFPQRGGSSVTVKPRQTFVTPPNRRAQEKAEAIRQARRLLLARLECADY